MRGGIGYWRKGSERGKTYGAIAARGVGVAFFEVLGTAVEDAWTPAAETA